MRRTLWLLCVVALAVCALGGGTITAGADAAAAEHNNKTRTTTASRDKLDYGARSMRMNDMEDFQKGLSSGVTPILLLLLPDTSATTATRGGSGSDDAAAAAVAARVREVSTALAELSVLVTYTSSTSPLATQMRLSVLPRDMANATALLFQGIHETRLEPATASDGSGNAARTRRSMHKPVSIYLRRWHDDDDDDEGDEDNGNNDDDEQQPWQRQLLRWVVGSVSPACLRRLESHDDVHAWLTAHKRYPTLPRVLYVTAASHVSPSLRVLSQAFCGDAVFGVVLDAFAAAQKTKSDGDNNNSNSNSDADEDAAAVRLAIAQHYGVKSAAEAPALMVLHPRQRRQDAATAATSRKQKRRATTNAHDDDSEDEDEDDEAASSSRQPALVDEDEVHRMRGCHANTTVVALLQFLDGELAHSYARTVRGNDTQAVQAAFVRRRHILRQLERLYNNEGGDEDDDDDDDDAATGEVKAHADVVYATTQDEWQQACGLYTSTDDTNNTAAAAAPQRRHCLVVFADGDGTRPRTREVRYATRVLRAAVARIAQQSVSLGRASQLQPVVLPATRAHALMRFFGVGENGLPDVLLLLHAQPSSSASAAAAAETDNEQQQQQQQQTWPYLSMRYVGAFTAEKMADFYVRRARLLAGRGADAVVTLGARRLTQWPPALQHDDSDTNGPNDAATDNSSSDTAAAVDSDDDAHRDL